MSPEPAGPLTSRALPRRALAAAALGAALALAGFVLGSSFGGWFVDDDVLNMRWVLEHSDAPWTALTERHTMHNHVRPFALLALWLGARLSDGQWWGVHTMLVVALGGIAAATAGLAIRRARAPAPPDAARPDPASASPTLVAAAALLLLAASAPFRGATTWNAWLGTAGEVAAGLAAVLCLDTARRAGRLGGVGLAAGFVVTAGLFKEPGWLVGPAVAAGLAVAELRAGRRGPLAFGLLALVLLVPAGMAFSWHPANAAQYLADGRPLAERALDGLVLAGRALAGAPRLGPLGGGAGLATPLLFAALGLAALPTGAPLSRRRALPLLSAAIGLALALSLPELLGPALALLLAAALWARRGEPPVELLYAAAAGLVMLPDPDLHAVHLLGAAAGLAAFTAGSLPALLAGLPRPAAVLLPLLSVAWVADSLRPAPPPAAEVLLSERLRPLAALARGLGADTIVLPPDDRRPGQALEGAEASAVYVREATRRLAPLFGLRTGGESRREVLAVYLDGAELQLDPTRERAALERNLLRQLPPLPWGGPAAAVPVDAGWYAVGALYRARGGEPAPALEARDTCGHTWRTPAASPEQAFRLTPFELAGSCLPLSLQAEGPLPPGVFPLLLTLDPPRLSLKGAPVEPALLDVHSREAQPTPLPRLDEPHGD